MSSSPRHSERGRKDIEKMSDTKKKNVRAQDEQREQARRRIKEKLYKGKACGELSDDDEAEILRYAQGIVTRRGEKPRE